MSKFFMLLYFSRDVKHTLVRRPVPEWYVMVDSWLNIPYPAWYLEYVRVHFKAELFPDAFMAAYANAAQSKDKHLEEVTSPSAQLITLLFLPCCDPPYAAKLYQEALGIGITCLHLLNPKYTCYLERGQYLPEAAQVWSGGENWLRIISLQSCEFNMVPVWTLRI